MANILIVDDEAGVRNLLKRILEKIEHCCTLAADAAAARGELENRDFDLLLCDIRMPGESGLQLISHVRERYPDTGIIMVTAVDTPQDMDAAVSIGIDGYIVKPFVTAQILVSVNNALQQRQLKMENRKYRKRLEAMVEKRTAQYRKTIQELEKSQMDLEESEFKFTTFCESSKDAMYIVTREGRFIWLNRAGREMFGYSEAELPSITILDFYRKPSDRPRILSLIDQNGFVDGLKVRYKTKAGRPIVARITTSVRKDPEGNITGYQGIIRDITRHETDREQLRQSEEMYRSAHAELKGKNKKLNAAYADLKATQARVIQQEKMASIGQLAAGVAHEINNPTGFVSSNLKTLSDYQKDMFRLVGAYDQLVSDLAKHALSDENLLDPINRIAAMRAEMDVEYIISDIPNLINESREGTERIKKIVIDLKDFAHPGKQELAYADINRNLDSTLNIVWNEIKYKAQVVRNYGKLPLVECFPQQLNQVFMNILVNAAQAIEGKGEITLTTAYMNGSVTVAIGDTGAGIAPENLPRIFDPFFTTKEVGKGTGLGLNVAYNIVKKHRGSIEVKSTVGRGTTFLIKIPVKENGDAAAEGTDLIEGNS